MGDVFRVALRPHNRWGGFKALRPCRQTYTGTTLSPMLDRDFVARTEAFETEADRAGVERMHSTLEFDRDHVGRIQTASFGDQHLR